MGGSADDEQISLMAAVEPYLLACVLRMLTVSYYIYKYILRVSVSVLCRVQYFTYRCVVCACNTNAPWCIALHSIAYRCISQMAPMQCGP